MGRERESQTDRQTETDREAEADTESEESERDEVGGGGGEREREKESRRWRKRCSLAPIAHLIDFAANLPPASLCTSLCTKILITQESSRLKRRICD